MTLTKYFHRPLEQGQTIIEVLIATAVVAVVMTAIAGGLTYSVKNTAESKYRALATYQAQEAMEVFRRERTLLGWDSFYAETIDGEYCLNSLPTSSESFVAMPAGECSAGVVIAGTEFTREAEIIRVSASEVRVTVVVSWVDGNRVREVEVAQSFRQWDTT